MEIKARVIQTILQLTKNEQYRYGEALELLQLMEPGNALLSLPDTPHNRKRLVLFFGSKLKQGDFTVYKPSKSNKLYSHPEPVTKSLETRNSELETIPDHQELSTELRLNKDIQRNLKGINAIANKMNQANSDHERKALWKEASQLQDQVSYNKKLLKQLSKGEKVNLKDTYFERKDENIFEVPENILERDRKLRYLSSRRSKRKTLVDKALEKHGKDSIQHQEAVREWKRFDEAVKYMRSKLP